LWQVFLMNLDKAVFYSGKDLYEHLNKRINENQKVELQSWEKL
jgi:hypothetical protein